MGRGGVDRFVSGIWPLYSGVSRGLAISGSGKNRPQEKIKENETAIEKREEYLELAIESHSRM